MNKLELFFRRKFHFHFHKWERTGALDRNCKTCPVTQDWDARSEKWFTLHPPGRTSVTVDFSGIAKEKLR